MLNCYKIAYQWFKDIYPYTQITMHFHSVDLIPPSPAQKKKPLKIPTLKPYDLILLFCMTIRELWILAAPGLG